MGNKDQGTGVGVSRIIGTGPDISLILALFRSLGRGDNIQEAESLSLIVYTPRSMAKQEMG